MVTGGEEVAGGANAWTGEGLGRGSGAGGDGDEAMSEDVREAAEEGEMS